MGSEEVTLLAGVGAGGAGAALTGTASLGGTGGYLLSDSLSGISLAPHLRQNFESGALLCVKQYLHCIEIIPFLFLISKILCEEQKVKINFPLQDTESVIQ